MNKVIKKTQLLQKRRWRIRKKVNGTSERPRLSIHFSNKHIYAQCINDVEGKTLLYVSSLSRDVKDKGLKANKLGAQQLGELFGAKAKIAGINAVVFDRGGRQYHGVVESFATGVRKSINF